MQNTDPAVRKAAFSLELLSAHGRLEILLLINESPLSMLQIAEQTGTTPYVVGSAIRSLETAGFAREHDMTARGWVATEAGRLVAAVVREMTTPDAGRHIAVGIANAPEIMP